LKEGLTLQVKEGLGSSHSPGGAGCHQDATYNGWLHEKRGTSMRDSRVEPTS
jgi:hypothetical protein